MKSETETAPGGEAEPKWLDWLGALARGEPEHEDQLGAWLLPSAKAPEIQLYYVLNIPESRLRDQVVIETMRRDAKGRLRPLRISRSGEAEGLSEGDSRLCLQLLGSAAEEPEDQFRAHDEAPSRRFVLRPGQAKAQLEAMHQTGRLLWRDGDQEGPLQLCLGQVYDFRLRLDEQGDRLSLEGELFSGDRRLSLQAPKLLLSAGLLLDEDAFYGLEVKDRFDWILRMRRNASLKVPHAERDALILALSKIPNLPPIVLPKAAKWQLDEVLPVPELCFSNPGGDQPLSGQLGFAYGEVSVLANQRRSIIADPTRRRLLRRDLKREARWIRRLAELGAVPAPGAQLSEGAVSLDRRLFLPALQALVAEHWRLSAQGEPIRVGGQLKSKLSSGIDWFDLEAELCFDGGARARLPVLLEAAEAKAALVPLEDSSYALAPKLLSELQGLKALGRAVGKKLRFSNAQAGLLDVLLTGFGELQADVKFSRLIEAQQRPKTEVRVSPYFEGQLRPYQQEGLNWLHFLETQRLGGCLADDMGLGKTVQTLAWLAGRHRPRHGERPAPSLIVVPKSLVQNWIQEGGRFVPDLVFLDYTGAKREAAELLASDVVVTTYGTLRQDILNLVEVPWKTVILDEAQAIKNPHAQVAKAVCLLNAELRLALSGTPIENALSELWSLFNFLNPGMLGSISTFLAGAHGLDEAWVDQLSAALRPLMLRRSKAEVLKELPEKTEQYLMVDLEGESQETYETLKDYYRVQLSGRFAAFGLEQSRIQVLKALLRLRQAACHPGLVDKARRGESSPKLQVLMDHVLELTQRGHKLLVFSSFTALLRMVLERLDEAGIGSCYLDGQCQNRQGLVDAFQQDAAKKVFLISLKAGGSGLTLTAADYVFILDPWWNPAAEAQAVDRAYRMGQKRPVFAYRMIARGTVEEKIMALQAEKRRLSDRIVSGEASGPLGALSLAELSEILS